MVLKSVAWATQPLDDSEAGSPGGTFWVILAWAFSALGELVFCGPSHQKRALKAPHTLLVSSPRDTKPEDLIPSTQGQEEEAMRAERLSSGEGWGEWIKQFNLLYWRPFILEAFSELLLSVSRRGYTGCQMSHNYLAKEPFFPSICGWWIKQSYLGCSLKRNKSQISIQHEAFLISLNMRPLSWWRRAHETKE